MRAITQEALGGPDVLTEVEMPRPRRRPVEVLVRVHAAGVNPADWEARASGWGGAVPRVLGFDVFRRGGGRRLRGDAVPAR